MDSTATAIHRESVVPERSPRARRSRRAAKDPGWTHETVFHRGDVFFRSLRHDILEAKSQIDLDFYIFAHDEIGKQIFRSLQRAAERGVRVRVIVDGVGSSNWESAYGEQARRSGIAYHVYHPLPVQKLLEAEDWTTLRTRALQFYRKANRRNHHKICLIDRELLYTGSFNLTARHTRQFAHAECWRDTGVRLAGPPVQSAQNVYDTLWHLRSKQQWKRAARSMWIRTNHTRELRRQTRLELEDRILQSKRRVWVTTPYFAPDLRLMNALCRAAEEGRDVRILLPSRSDVSWAPLVSRAYFQELLKCGVRIFLYKPSILHAKMTLIDDWVVVGSTNMNHRSIVHDLEFDVRLKSRRARTEIEMQFLKDLGCSHEIDLGDCESDNVLTRWTGQLLYQFRYFL